MPTECEYIQTRQVLRQAATNFKIPQNLYDVVLPNKWGYSDRKALRQTGRHQDRTEALTMRQAGRQKGTDLNDP